MKNKDINARIRRAFTLALPNVKDAVIKEATGQKGQVIIMTNTTKKRSVMKTVTAFGAAAAVFIFAILGGVFYSDNYTAASVVSLDVNPSIEIEISKTERVIDVEAKNADGELIIGDMDFDGADLDVVINALIGSMLRNGYLNDLANSILISVDGDDDERNALLQAELAEKINSILSTEAFSGAVMSQTIDKTDKLTALADEYDITLGKAQLISDIVAVNELYTFADLVPLSINELNLLSASVDTSLEHVESKGEASDKSYIGTDMAKKIAAEHANVTLENAKFERTELDFDDGIMVYDVEFRVGGVEYDYEINAVTGAIAEFDIDGDDDDSDDGKDNNIGDTNTNANTPSNGQTEITQDRAKEIAFTHAGLNAGSVKGLQLEREVDDGVVKYEIEFNANGVEYDYEINAVTGTIIKCEREADDDDDNGNGNGANDTSSAPTIIGKDKAKDIALDHANVTVEFIKDYSCELDSDDGVLKYEIEFESGKYDYEYKINARTGAVIEHQREVDDDYSEETADTTPPATDDKPANSTATAPALIGKDKAKDIALGHANVTDESVSDYSCELDEDDGVQKYEIEFKSGGVEYEYKVNALSGDIISFDSDVDDDNDDD